MSMKLKPFCGIDGEGAGVDELGRQQYRLLRAGEFELYNDGKHLTTEECLEFITGLPRDRIYVGFFFDYDATQILRDLNSERRIRLLRNNSHSGQQGISPYMDWRHFQIDYMPRKYLSIRRRGRDNEPRMVNDVGGFYQSTFVRAITDWNIGTPELRAAIAETKARRAEFTEIGAAEREYCRQECILLAELMETFREACQQAGYVPKRWQGAGWLGGRMLETHKVAKRRDLAIPKAVEAIADAAYYGGRFETARVGVLDGRIYEYDISSAYPAAMRRLPCLTHGYWRHLGGTKGSGLYASELSFHHPARNSRDHLCGFPVRQKSGTLSWPREARGTYWSPEIEAAERAGAVVTAWHDTWEYNQLCDCKPFDWLDRVYEERRRIGKDARGKPLKLGMNAIYGKTAQSIGSAPWGIRVWAGLITALTRAQLLDGYMSDPGAVVMLATDALYSSRPLAQVEANISPLLGGWERKDHENMFIVQPGLYWFSDDDQPKTRGIPRARVLEHQQTFIDTWQGYLQSVERGEPIEPPSVEIPLVNFIGLRLAQARNKPELAGRWLAAPKRISFDWSSKRIAGAIAGGSLATLPQRGGADLVSLPYQPKMTLEAELARLELEAMPDYEPGIGE